jgi:hypothetical protein
VLVETAPNVTSLTHTFSLNLKGAYGIPLEYPSSSHAFALNLKGALRPN